MNNVNASIKSIKWTGERNGYLVKFSKKNPLAQLLAQSIDEFITYVALNLREGYFEISCIGPY